MRAVNTEIISSWRYLFGSLKLSSVGVSNFSKHSTIVSKYGIKPAGEMPSQSLMRVEAACDWILGVKKSNIG
jgi:hypothetical protein